MILLSPELAHALRTNHAARRAAHERNLPEPDPLPVVKFFNPMGLAQWVATELAEDGDTLFGLADLGFGCPELGFFSLAEIAALRLPLGRRIERDILFTTDRPLSEWADMADRTCSLLQTEYEFRCAAGTELQRPRRGG